ncbi:hypothetical protein RJ640_025312, partial [Escallonia rubra]
SGKSSTLLSLSGHGLSVHGDLGLQLVMRITLEAVKLEKKSPVAQMLMSVQIMLFCKYTIILISFMLNLCKVQSYGHEVHFYDFHIVYNSSYRVPVLYFRAYCSDGQPLTLSDIKEDLPASSMKMLKESKWTFITEEEHPFLNRPWYTLHPCGTSEWMKLLFASDASVAKDGVVAEQYLVSWFSVVGQVVGLKTPLEMLHSCTRL